MASTIEDFVRMVWERQSAALVMLSDFTERGEEHSAPYLPGGVDAPLVVGPFTVRQTEPTENMDGNVGRRRVLQIMRTDMPDSAVTVTHFQFTAWSPDDTPASIPDFVTFCQVLERRKKEKQRKEKKRKEKKRLKERRKNDREAG